MTDGETEFKGRKPLPRAFTAGKLPSDSKATCSAPPPCTRVSTDTGATHPSPSPSPVRPKGGDSQRRAGRRPRGRSRRRLWGAGPGGGEGSSPGPRGGAGSPGSAAFGRAGPQPQRSSPSAESGSAEKPGRLWGEGRGRQRGGTESGLAARRQGVRVLPRVRLRSRRPQPAATLYFCSCSCFYLPPLLSL